MDGGNEALEFGSCLKEVVAAGMRIVPGTVEMVLPVSLHSGCSVASTPQVRNEVPMVIDVLTTMITRGETSVGMGSGTGIAILNDDSSSTKKPYRNITDFLLDQSNE